MRMMFEQLIAQMRRVKMDVNLSCGNRLMTEHLLDGPEIRPPFEQMRRKAMAQRVGRYILSDTGPLGQLPDNQENHNPRQFTSAAIEE